MRLFSTEQVSKYHPDKYADQISDAILEACLAQDKKSRVACETLVKGNTIVLAGEITTKADVDYRDVALSVAQRLKYPVDEIHEFIVTQSPEISGGVDGGEEQGAGDQGMMYGYACDETESMLPFGFDLANKIIARIEDDVENNPHTKLQGDAKTQVTVDLDEKPDMESVKKVLVSVCHKPEYSLDEVAKDVIGFLQDCGINTNVVDVIINPAGAWTIGGPTADCGLTGRKIVCDQYGGYCPVGGGAFSGKDPSKVDRSGAYMARKIACDMVKKHHLKWAEVQVAYAIGMAQPMSVTVKCNNAPMNDALSREVAETYDLTPAGIIKQLNLLEAPYAKLAGGCHYRELA